MELEPTSDYKNNPEESITTTSKPRVYIFQNSFFHLTYAEGIKDSIATPLS